MDMELTRASLQRLLDVAREGSPGEVCGLLLGSGPRIDAISPAANIHPTPRTHFEIDPQALIDAHRAARNGGPEVVGYYHSHPDGPAEPSDTDRAQAAGDGRVWAIVARGDVTFWRDDEDGFAKLSYIVSEG
jgi:proteasome lid subunit RPN8/RPN11